MQHVPMLNLWRGQGCGSACLKFHAGIDEAPDTVIHEVWARKFQQENGNKATMSEATAFQVFLRIPASALDALQQTTASGVYVEPREPGLATGPSPEYAVIWLPGMDYQAAQHCKRKTDKALALTRIGHKYGVRVHSKDEEVAFRALRPEHVFSRVKVVEKYRLHPLPHGLTRQGLQQLLDAWQWAAKPLQPSKGDAAGAAWDVGAECPPPSAALSTCLGFVLPVQISSPASPPAVDSLRTHGLMGKIHGLSSSRATVTPRKCLPVPQPRSRRSMRSCVRRWMRQCNPHLRSASSWMGRPKAGFNNWKLASRNSEPKVRSLRVGLPKPASAWIRLLSRLAP